MKAKGDENAKHNKFKCVSDARLKMEWLHQLVVPKPQYPVMIIEVSG